MKLVYKSLVVLVALFVAPIASASSKGASPQLFPNFSSTPRTESSTTIVHMPLIPSPRVASSTKPIINTITNIGWNWDHSTGKAPTGTSTTSAATSHGNPPSPVPAHITASSTTAEINIGHGTNPPARTPGTIEFLQSFFGRFFN